MIKEKNAKTIILFLITIIGLILGYGLLKNELWLMLSYYGVLLLLGIAGLPLTFYLFRNFRDNGYIFSKVIGLLLSGFLMWLLSSFHILKFNMLNAYLCVLIIMIISFMILFIRKKNNFDSIKVNIKEKLPHILKLEVAFLLVFILASYVKGFNPDISYSTEKYMDYGYMTVIDKTDYMPPMDIWFSGEVINYYYYGQYISTFLTKLSAVGINYGYNFMLITLFCLTYFIGYTICYNLIYLHFKKDKDEKKKKIFSHISGMIAGTAITIAGNMHYVIYGLIIKHFGKFLGISVEHSYWFPDSTRYIGYMPDVDDKTIHEFPSYSFILGDLHAHVINIIFVLTLVGLLFAYLLNNKEKYKDNLQKSFKIKDIFNPIIILIGFLIGIFKMTNYWDYPIYLVVTGAIILFSNIRIYKKIGNVLKASLLMVLLFFGISVVISLPFTVNFTMMASQIKFCTHHSLFYQLLVLWGLPITLVIYYTCHTIKKFKLKGKESKIFNFFKSFDLNDLFIITIGICAIGLIIMPEIVYVKDIYEGGYSRANTMFKLTYQAYILFGLCFGYMLIRLLLSQNKNIRKKGIIFTILFMLTVGYFGNCLNSWFGNVLKMSNYKTLDGVKYLENYNISGNITSSDDYSIIKYLNENASKDDVILESYGYSYTYANRISVFTGLTTPVGWTTHEHLWRSSSSNIGMPEVVQERIDDLDIFFETTDLEKLKSIIKKYNVTYIIIGYSEREKYGDGAYLLPNEEELISLGDIVYKVNSNYLYPSSYIIKVK